MKYKICQMIKAVGTERSVGMERNVIVVRLLLNHEVLLFFLLLLLMMGINKIRWARVVENVGLSQPAGRLWYWANNVHKSRGITYPYRFLLAHWQVIQEEWPPKIAWSSSCIMSISEFVCSFDVLRFLCLGLQAALAFIGTTKIWSLSLILATVSVTVTGYIELSRT